MNIENVDIIKALGDWWSENQTMIVSIGGFVGVAAILLCSASEQADPNPDKLTKDEKKRLTPKAEQERLKV